MKKGSVLRGIAMLLAVVMLSGCVGMPDYEELLDSDFNINYVPN